MNNKRGGVEMEKKIYRTVSISCKAKDLLDEIAKAYAINRTAFMEKLIVEAHGKMFSEEK